MTITTNVSRNEYTATSGQTTFSYTFKIYAADELAVYKTAASATAADSDLITTYSVTGVGNSAGGTIILNTGATLNDKVSIVHNADLDRETAYSTNADFSPTTVNSDNDRAISLVKQVYDLVRRIPKFSKAQQGVNDLTMAKPVASQFLRWKSDASGLESVSLNTFATGDNAAAISCSTPAGRTGTDVQAIIDEYDTAIDALSLDSAKLNDVITLSGLAANATTTGGGTGTTLSDATIKVNLQELETAVESKTNFWALISSATPAAVNEFELVLDTATYKDFLIELNGISGGADDSFRMRLAYDSPANYYTGASDYIVTTNEVSGVNGTATASFATLNRVNASEENVESVTGLNGFMEIHNANSTTAPAIIFGRLAYTNDAGTRRSLSFTCMLDVTPAALTKLKFYWQTASEEFDATGTIRLYGRA